MKHELSALVLAILIVALITGCGRRHRHVVVHPTYGKAVVIKKGHAHDARCGHFRHGNTWYVAKKGHVHGPKCGHHQVKGVWIVR